MSFNVSIAISWLLDKGGGSRGSRPSRHDKVFFLVCLSCDTALPKCQVLFSFILKFYYYYYLLCVCMFIYCVCACMYACVSVPQHPDGGQRITLGNQFSPSIIRPKNYRAIAASAFFLLGHLTDPRCSFISMSHIISLSQIHYYLHNFKEQATF